MNKILDFISKQPIAVKSAILVAVLISMAVVEYRVLYVPLNATHKDLQKRRDELQVKLLENQAVADNLPLFQEEVNVLNEQLKQAVSLLPNEADIQAILRQLSNLARKSNVEMHLFKPGSVVSRGFYNEISMDLRLEGTFNDIAMYLDQLGRLSRIINVQDLSFSNQHQEGRVMRMTIDCRATTFMFRGGAG
ncbi:MAG: type 4a pilus biogenesis protein PilO [Pseudomonadota bacterium]